MASKYLNESNIFSKRSDDPLTIQFKNVHYTVKKVEKSRKSRFQLLPDKVTQDIHILNDVSGSFRSGRLTAIMGSSGAGKTSLLQVLAGKCTSGTVDGKFYINDTSIRPKEIKERSGFVFQDDLIMATMTVREAIQFSANLRLPREVQAAERTQRVDAAISLLNLEKCQNTFVGNSLIKGISGGERKRCSIAMEVITNPHIIFLDEPTSGLDSFTAYSVVSTLKDLALSGRVVVATIHQPSAETFNLFDDLLLLCKGQVMYHGPVSDMLSYFEKQGYPCPIHTNPADWLFMSILNQQDDGENLYDVSDDEEAGDADTSVFQRTLNAEGAKNDAVEESSDARICKLLAAYKASDSLMQVPTVKNQNWKLLKHGKKERAPLGRQFKSLMGRSLRNVLRDPMVLRARMGQAIAFGIIIGIVYLNVNSRTGYSGLQDRTGLLFFVTMNSFMSTTMIVLPLFAVEKFVYNRENNAGYYTLFPFYFSKLLVEFPFNFFGPLIMYVIVYFMAHLYLGAGQFFLFVLIGLAICIVGFGFGIFFATLFKELQIALAVVPAIVLPLSLFSGLFSSFGDIPVYFNWIQYISPLKYGYQAYLLNEFSHANIEMPNGQPPNSGDNVLSGLGILGSVFGIGACIGMLLLLASFFYVGTYFLLLKQGRESTKGAVWIGGKEHHSKSKSSLQKSHDPDASETLEMSEASQLSNETANFVASNSPPLGREYSDN